MIEKIQNQGFSCALLTNPMEIERVFRHNQPREGRVAQQKENFRELDVVQPRSKKC